MGTFLHPITLTGPSGASETLEMVVGTDTLFTVVPTSMLQALGVKPHRTVPLRDANGRIEQWRLGRVDAQIDGDMNPILCLFGSDDEVPLLGRHTVDTFLLTIDPLQQRLVPKDAYLMAAAGSR